MSNRIRRKKTKTKFGRPITSFAEGTLKYNNSTDVVTEKDEETNELRSKFVHKDRNKYNPDGSLRA